MSGPNLDNYVEVSERIIEFRDKYPDGVLQSELVPSPVEGFVIVKAYAYRTPDDPRPGTGMAWEPVPGKTPFTRDSELQNAETSSWGRALIAVGAADAKRGIASANEVRNRAESASKPSNEPAIEPPADDELMAAVEDWITKATQSGVEVDAGKVRTFAVMSKANAERSIDTLRKRIEAQEAA